MNFNQGLPTLSSALSYLQSFANLNNSEILLQQVFEVDLSFGSLLSSWQQGDFPSLPQLKVVPTVSINGAQGAFAGETNTLYLSQELLELGNLTALTQVFLEEYGHYLDNQLNLEDTPGDEGEYFSALIMGQTPSDADIFRLRSENDWATVMLGGQLTAIEQNSSIVQITSNNFDDGVDFDFYRFENDDYGDKLKVSGNRIAWQSDEGIYLFNSFIPKQLSNNSSDQDPQVQGNSVVWSSDSGIFLYDDRQTIRLPGSDGSSLSPQVYEGKVVWQQSETGGGVFLFDGIRTNQLGLEVYGSSSTPSIYESTVAWVSWNKIYYYNINGSSIREVEDGLPVSSLGGAKAPAISNSIIAGTEGNRFDYGSKKNSFRETDDLSLVYVYDLNTGQTTRLSNASPIRDLQVSGNYTVWQEGLNESVNARIMFNNGLVSRNLSSDKFSSQWDSNPKLFGDNIVWERWDGLDYEIMHYDGNTTRQITNNNRDDRFPQVSDDIIAWTGWDGNDWEIFQTYVGPDNGLQDKLTTTLIRFQNTDRPGTYLYAGEQEAISIRQNYPNFVEEGGAFRVATGQADPLLQPFYRFRNTAAGREGTYLFAGAQESISIRQNYPNFVEEGIAFYAFPGGIGGGMTNFNRFQNNELPGTYLFSGPSESGSIVGSNYPFTYEGAAFAAG